MKKNVPSLVVHSGRVYQYKSHNIWKESWLCIEDNATLVWKRKDAYQVKGSVDLRENVDKIALIMPKEKHLVEKKKPFFFRLPMKCDDKVMVKMFAVMNREDLELWMDAFATVVGEWKLFKTVRQQHISRVATAKEVNEDTLEESLTYNELLPFLRTIWDEYISARHNPNAMEELTTPKKRLSAKHIFPTPPSQAQRSRSYSAHESDYVTTSEEEDNIRID